MSARVVLAYSGGLDTSVAIPYLAKMTGGDVVAVSLDLGQGGEDMESVRQRALDCGAVESIVIDAKDEFAEEYCVPTIKANGMYMKQYPLVSAISRPLITKHLVKRRRSLAAPTSPTAVPARVMTRYASRFPSVLRILPSKSSPLHAIMPGPAIRPSPSRKRSTCRLSSPLPRHFPSIRTCGVAR